MEHRDIRRVIVVFKTHLDIGYTALAAGVLKNYRERFIPSAVSLAEAANREGKKRFVWTTGAYLIKHFLERAPEAKQERLCAAIRRGDVKWHGLACTTHTELMDEALFQYGLSVSKELDRRFGVSTIAAKMTDVPGHTVAMVPLLAQSGIEYLHIGVNGSSRVPEVPPLFRWRYGADEVAVNYAGGYGAPTLLENGVALEFCHAQDNAGPPSLRDLDALYETLAARYPNARIEAGTLDDFALAVREVKDTLPVVTQEIGDTWIHGVASDPLKVSQFRRLLALRAGWEKSGAFTPGSPGYGAFMEPLLLVAEHTWGMDTKKYLLDFTNWAKADFQAARKRDATSYALFSPQNAHLLAGLLPELRAYRGESETSSYSLFESSHAEQRAYIGQALAALPKELSAAARETLSFCMPEMPEGPCYTVGETIRIGNWRTAVGKDGQLVELANGKTGVARMVSLGLFEYQTFGGKDVADCFFDYGRDLKENFCWAECDFGKPGLRYVSVQSEVWRAVPERIAVKGDTLYIRLRPDARACGEYGCPRGLLITHQFGETVRTTLYWKDKDAVRSPEAIWLQMALSVSDPNGWRIEKLGRPVSPLRVVRGGSRKLHCAERLAYEGADGSACIVPYDSPLVSVGGRHLYDVGDACGDPADGFYFLLCNNRWGTNFKQWFEDDMRFAFETRVRANPLSGANGPDEE